MKDDVLAALDPAWLVNVLGSRIPEDAVACYCSADEGDREHGDPITVFCVTPNVLIRYHVSSTRTERQYLSDKIQEDAVALSAIRSIDCDWTGWTERAGDWQSKINRGEVSISLREPLGADEVVSLPRGSYDYQDREKATMAAMRFVDGIYEVVR